MQGTQSEISLKLITVDRHGHFFSGSSKSSASDFLILEKKSFKNFLIILGNPVCAARFFVAR